MKRALVLLSMLVLPACAVDLQHDLTEDDANDIYVLLQRHGIDTKKIKEEGGNEPRYIISVAKQDVADAAQLLRDYALPRPHADGLAVFKKMKGMIPTQTEERAMLLEALGGEVSNALNRVPNVLEALTIVNIPEVNDLTQPEKKPMPTASVFIKYRMGPERQKPISEEEVKAFVAKGVPELTAANVQVLMTAAAPPEAEGDAARNQTVFGLQMTKQSAEQFKAMVAVTAVVLMLMAGLTAFAFVRRPSSNGKRRASASE
ncbi:MAG: type III secretion protein [Myxococcaceae bacterium]|nr:type III secretion protein [Myxococcaceae bacterium]